MSGLSIGLDYSFGTDAPADRQTNRPKELVHKEACSAQVARWVSLFSALTLLAYASHWLSLLPLLVLLIWRLLRRSNSKKFH